MSDIRYYNGIKMGADENLHNKLFTLFSQKEANKEIRIRILGAGQGAFDQRLIDSGYKNITAVDIENNYKVKNQNFSIVDLNKDFVDLGVFEYVLQWEVIEHLENQFHFIRNISKLMDKSNLKCIEETYNRKYFSKNDFKTNSYGFKVLYILSKIFCFFKSSICDEDVVKIYVGQKK
jgi:2-polyprenyl-3-methyl-5-hydroxy-6-metoxy-1,4-benzoquinol methylase